jgi:hypothetical protein
MVQGLSRRAGRGAQTPSEAVGLRLIWTDLPSTFMYPAEWGSSWRSDYPFWQRHFSCHWTLRQLECQWTGKMPALPGPRVSVYRPRFSMGTEIVSKIMERYSSLDTGIPRARHIAQCFCFATIRSADLKPSAKSQYQVKSVKVKRLMSYLELTLVSGTRRKADKKSPPS